ncbi:MAG TPA: bifunctional UDP-N-acetylglucosamine diphosphorylase/glucosamine-1-phosphate N-acetyltransferase GlmU [Pyrinomonadaceae bacterium]|nr:bifunctional UDP-N-acetylglucosamine diphosphorylase/glucosamine-1-phosphate N-acetyltransferase GlmU [Pyrinomonadaceae bacterium]
MESLESRGEPLDILILAAGMGTRMRSNTAKVLHLLDGRPLITHVCHTAAALAPRKVYVVVGHQGDEVQRAVSQELPPEQTVFVLQREQHGTGDAVNSAREFLENDDALLLVLSGDVPMIRAETLASLIQLHRNHRGKGAACTILTVKLKDPTGYGRIIRDEGGIFERIVEQRDASSAEAEINEINSGIYCFHARKLFKALSRVQNHNDQGEYYLTDVPGLLKAEGEDVAIYNHADPFEVEGVNNRVQLTELERQIRRRTMLRLMLDYGVTFIDPRATYVSEQTSIGRDTIIHPNVTIEGRTEIGDGCEIRSGTRISNSKIGRGVEIRDNCLIVDSEIADGAQIGPMAHLRGHAEIGAEARIGNFVEVKKSKVGRGTKASHLTYLGDAIIGENTNIGAGAITCNYDGVRKNETHIGNDVKIGSDTMLIAPVTVGDGAATGAGSVVTKDVGAGELVVGAPARAIKTIKKDGA